VGLVDTKKYMEKFDVFFVEIHLFEENRLLDNQSVSAQQKE
jgi:hypothetical protein